MSEELLPQAKKSDKPTEQPASTKPQVTAERQQHVQKVFAIKHVDVDAIARTLSVFPVPVHPNRELKVIGVSAPAALLPTIEETIRRLDVPPPAQQNVEITFYLLIASDQDNVGAVVPQDLDGVVKQLRATFAFKGFRLVDTLVVRNRDRQGANASGFTKFDPDVPHSSTYGLSYRSASIVADERGRSIRLDGLKFSARIAVKGPSPDTGGTPSWIQDSGISTDIDVREGQKVVVGKAAVGSANTALILVIAAKILE